MYARENDDNYGRPLRNLVLTNHNKIIFQNISTGCISEFHSRARGRLGRGNREVQLERFVRPTWKQAGFMRISAVEIDPTC